MALGIPLSALGGGGMGGQGGGNRSGSSSGRAAAIQFGAPSGFQPPSNFGQAAPQQGTPPTPTAGSTSGDTIPPVAYGPPSSPTRQRTHPEIPDVGELMPGPVPAPKPGVTIPHMESPQETAMSNWLQSALGLNQTQYNSTQANLFQQAAIGGAYQDYQIGNANQQYGITTGNIDLDKWRANQTYALLQRELGNKRGTADATWAELNRNVGKNREFTGQERALRDWLIGKNKGFNGETRDAGIRDARFSFDKGKRAAYSAATAAGAFTSQGHRDAQGDLATSRDNAISDAGLQFRRNDAGLTSDQWQSGITYNKQMESLLAQVNSGQISYQDALNTINAAGASGSLANQYANQSAGLGYQQAGLNQSSATTGAQLSYQQMLAQLAGQGGTATNTMNQSNLALIQQYLASIGYGG